MTSQKLDRAAFLARHPRCCFCNGERPAEEPDHVPARICFKRKQGPENMEYPACVPCNRAAAASEQVAALYIRMFDHNADNLDVRDLQKLILGVENNTPEALPRLNAAAVERHQAAEAAGSPDADALSLSARTAEVPQAAHRHLELFAVKSLYAVHYRVRGGFAGPRHRRVAIWAQIGTPAADHLAGRVEQWFADVEVGQRSNIDLGDQFHYRHGYNAPSGMLGMSMTFGQSFIFFCALGPARQMEQLDQTPRRYLPVRELGAELRREERARRGAR